MSTNMIGSLLVAGFFVVFAVTVMTVLAVRAIRLARRMQEVAR